MQLDRLFGSDAGMASHYEKNMTIDPNGQTFVSYFNANHQMVASALAGDPPKSNAGGNSLRLEPLKSTLNAEKKIVIDLFEKDANGKSICNLSNPSNTSLVFQTEILVSSPSYYSFQYALDVSSFHDNCMSNTICFDCIYDLDIQILDECKNQLAFKNQKLIHKTIGKFIQSPENGELIFDVTCLMPNTFQQDEVLDSVLLNPGNYQIQKILSVNKEARDYYVSQYLDSTKNSCYKSIHYFQDSVLQHLDTLSCSIGCAECMESLGLLDDFVSSGKGTDLDYQLLLEECQKPCQQPSICETTYLQLLSDVSPGGQYGEFRNSSTQLLQPSDFKLSVFNLQNVLPKNQSSQTANWKYPLLLLQGKIFSAYLDENKNRTMIRMQHVDLVNAQNCIPQVDNNSIGSPTNNGIFQDADGYYIYPENLSNFSDFIWAWKAGWERSLVTYHPEYCYYESCSQYAEKQHGESLSSDEFDKMLNDAQTFQQAVQFKLIPQPPIDYNYGVTPVLQRVFDYSDLQSTHVHDPFLTHLYFQQYGNQLKAAVINMTNGFSMPEMAAMSARCHNLFIRLLQLIVSILAGMMILCIPQALKTPKFGTRNGLLFGIFIYRKSKKFKKIELMILPVEPFQ